MSGGRERSEDASAKAPPRLRALQIYLCGTEQEPCVMCGLFPSEYTIYVIMVLWEGVEWQIRKRYSEFRYLHDFLLSKFGNRLGNPVFALFHAHHFPSCAFTALTLPRAHSFSPTFLSRKKLQSYHTQGAKLHRDSSRRTRVVASVAVCLQRGNCKPKLYRLDGNASRGALYMCHSSKCKFRRSHSSGRSHHS